MIQRSLCVFPFVIYFEIGGSFDLMTIVVCNGEQGGGSVSVGACISERHRLHG
jgi:hypothetical protein